ncbi:mannitol-1-phosphate 5-dehydrogenase [Cryobacterium adonitolivorans]|uniref:Mannitol-1-phosphate 5-dehydrogenase n=1 Tax=Cryobacterium adonitolivorans TaxID=1259189 RepID=A0A4R8W245_9MICO|nr:mannitol-1-phosphate 5-dehydrogenase [Cryobacterium adonitolivorans]TFC01050.1 mannitol-1-phosphate 5-dehydrogenase [Cryobacterium adonitolivorans]
MRAVHFGAGNIGRGFIALALHRAGYDVTFVDVSATLIDAINAASKYEVREIGPIGVVHLVDGISGINSRTDPDAAARAVAAADVVTCAVGATVLPFIAPIIRAGILARASDAPKLAILACENAIGASDTLREHVADGGIDTALLFNRTVFANTAVDRIVPGQASGGIDVVVGEHFEWIIDRTPFTGAEPKIPDARYVDNLTPFIERKLFAVNTAHATTAYYGFLAGAESIADALAIPSVRAEVDAVVAASSALLVDSHGFDPEELAAYIAQAIKRFEDPDLPDTCIRIGRQPLRKISRTERFIAPAARLAESGGDPAALVRAYGAALRFDVLDDAQSVELQSLLASHAPATFVTRVTGIEASHPLFAALLAETASVEPSLV